ncbi:MAG: primosomal protein N' [Firmicutes bacterium]|nr:primosomal protein N' [Bacillota bacterium]
MKEFADIIINRKSPAVDRVFTYRIPSHLQAEAEVGMLARVPFNREKLEGVIIRIHEEEPEGFQLKDVADLLSPRPLFTRELLQLSAWVAEYYCCSRAAALQAMLPAGMVLSGQPPKIFRRDYFRLSPNWQGCRKTAKRQELAELLQQEGEMDQQSLQQAGFSLSFLRAAEQAGLLLRESRRLDQEEEDWPTQATELNEEQRRVYEDICREWQGQQRPYLLHGVTGSGKTEIYLRLIQKALAAGKQSILLVPEIALSSQMLDMLSRRLDQPVALLHSGLRPAERRQIWQDIAEGRYSIVVGARSAVFAPVPQLGLLILDEAHESSYKQDNTPRFSALTTGIRRAELAGAQIVLGSATPDVESRYHAEQGDYAYGQLTAHYHPAPLPKIQLVDMREELRAGHRLIFSRALLDGLSQTLARGGQSILFLNRRGYYQHFSCRDCGHVLCCPHCDVALSYHEGSYGGQLKCHYCGRRLRPPELCPVCGSRHIRHFGIGTQRVVDELQRLYPEARIARLDSDVMEERGSHQRIFQAMRSGELDMLVGTQMVAKGLDFPRVELAAVVAADTLLNLPDWRAGERTFQLITQLIGRAGRRDRQGLAIIQTYTPEAGPIQAAADGDYEKFYQEELLQRQLHAYPPFCHLIHVLLSARDQGDVIAASNRLGEALQPLLEAEEELCGPADAPLGRIKDRYRRQLILKTGDVLRAGSCIEREWAKLQSRDRAAKECLISIDIDPLAMM